MIKVGSIVRISARGRESGIYQNNRDRHGVVVRFGSPNFGNTHLAYVRWNGLKHAGTSIHVSFLEEVYGDLPPDDEPLPPEVAKRFAHVEITR